MSEIAPQAGLVLDCRGLKCPLPVLRLEKALETVDPGSTLVVLATDPVARIDIPLLCRQRDLACSLDDTAETLRFTIIA